MLFAVDAPARHARVAKVGREQQLPTVRPAHLGQVIDLPAIRAGGEPLARELDGPPTPFARQRLQTASTVCRIHTSHTNPISCRELHDARPSPERRAAMILSRIRVEVKKLALTLTTRF